ncbi:MAG: response regulator transcription factor [Natronospirillum sp.]|uniref:response regulator transcription factor n=1 Tax=Natronospirillum sp. TaxID=2812955 RepID=UPI0025FEB088|nr:response regulator transcription factor [Natronospirillum sp.]MCH8552100.1 response regulator transcription factor [Natronospirillum sp.]
MNHNPYARLMLVEDDERLAQLTAEYLEREGYHVDIVGDGAEAAREIPAQQPDLVILDVMLPGQDGLAVCRQVRPAYSGSIILLTARDQIMDEILGLEVGADDYLAKPVAPERLLARVRAHLRRIREFSGQGKDSQPASGASAADKRPSVDQVLTLEESDREAWCRGRKLDLTRPQYELLALFLAHPGKVLSREDISGGLRGVPYDGYSRHIDILVSGLRQAIGVKEVIKTVRNRGYMLVRHWPSED